MTAIIATFNVMAADGRESWDDGRSSVTPQPKIRRIGYRRGGGRQRTLPLLLGFAGTSGVCEHLWALPDVLELGADEPLMAGLNRTVLGPVLDAAKPYVAAGNEDDVEFYALALAPGNILALSDGGGGFYRVDAPAAIGSGAIPALAANHALVPHVADEIDRLARAIEATAATVGSVGAAGATILPLVSL